MPSESESIHALMPRLLQLLGRGGRVAAGLVRLESTELQHATPELELLLGSLGLPRSGAEPARWLLEAHADGAQVEVEKIEMLVGSIGWALIVARPTADLQLRILVGQFARRYSLSPSEQREVEHLAKGLSIKDSAQQLEISPETVRVRRKRVYRKMGITGHEALLAKLCREALVPPRNRDPGAR